MCGIFGYIGTERDASRATLEGLQRLDYRGYDSWGVGVITEDGIRIEKQVGLVGAKTTLPHASIGIGHTRWATHGSVTRVNAHPHFASDESFILAHNGIVENADALKIGLQKAGYAFKTQTDTESIVRLVEQKRSSRPRIEHAVRAAFSDLSGRNTIIVLTREGEIVAARNGSPLVIGIGTHNQIYFSSDVFSFSPHVQKIVVVENGQMVVCRDKSISLFDINSGKSVPIKYENNHLKDVRVDKGPYKHYMMKEIREAPYVIRQVMKEDPKKFAALARDIRKARTVYCIGSGTAGAAAAQMAYYLRVYGGVRAISLIGAEAVDYRELIGRGDLMIAPSQSGETADVLEVLELAHARGATIASFINMPGSMMTRISDHKFMANAGPEICVMSTKIFDSQIAWGYLVAKYVQGKQREGLMSLRKAAMTIERTLADTSYESMLKKHAARLAKKQHIFLLGKGQNLQIIKEAMVKMIEGSYIHAHAIAAGDLKHYAITLMEKGVSVIATVSNDSVRGDMLNAIHEVRARGADVCGVSPTHDVNFDYHLKIADAGETSALVNIVPLQLLAYYMAVFRGNNVDKPRNIAKSVTVK